jgi:hypothetical protein
MASATAKVSSVQKVLSQFGSFVKHFPSVFTSISSQFFSCCRIFHSRHVHQLLESPNHLTIFMNPATGQPNRAAEKSEQVLFRYCSSNIGRMDSGVRFESMGIKEIEIQSC